MFTYIDILQVLKDYKYPRELVVNDDDFYVMLRLVKQDCICAHRPGFIILSTMIVPRSSWAPVIADPDLVEKHKYDLAHS